jgi:formylglycine-generating enzyme required for sulfatase activity
MNRRYPFKFLDAYNKADTDIFFGRDEEVEALYQMTFQSDILLVYGASGTGKTSLINCGLASRFQAHDWLALNIRRGHDLNASLQQKLEEASAAGSTEAPDLDLSWLDEDEAEVAASPLSRQLQEIYRRYFRPLYLIFDQFEELYILGSKAEQAQFIQNVQEIQAVDQPVKMIFVIREEYLGHLFEFERAVPQLLRKKLRVEPMNLDKVGQVVRGAATLDRSNVRLEAGQEAAIVEGIFEKIRGTEQTLAIQLPYLQVFLDKLYLQVTGDEARQAEAVFTTRALAEMGDIGDVLRDFLEEQAVRIQKQLSDQYPKLPEDAVWQILSPLATLEGTKEPLLEETLLQRLPQLPPGAVKAGLQALDQSRILRYDEQEGRYEVAHDSLAARIAEHRNDDEIALLEIRRLISSQMALKAEARALFTAKQLNLIDPYLDKLGLEPEALQLIEVSRREVAATARRKRRRNLIIGSVLAAAAIVSVFFAIQANTKTQEALQANKDTKAALAEAEREKARSDSLSLEAQAAATEALAEKARSDSLSLTAQAAREQAETALAGLQRTTAQICDNLLAAAEEDILNLDYEAALEKIMNAGDLKVDDQKVGKALMEIVYVFNETDRHQAAVDLTGELSQLLRSDRFRLDQDRDTLANLRGYLGKADVARYTFLKKRYFPEMVAVPGGTFTMGCDPEIEPDCKSDETQHEVRVGDFQMARHETTWWQYHLFCQATGREYESPQWGADGDNPVVNVSWYDAIEYANWVSKQLGRDTVYSGDLGSYTVRADWSKKGYRLPTEAEWEYAAKGGKAKQPFIYSGADSLDLVGWFGENSDTGDGIQRTRAVAQKSANGLGLYDMSGNVWEWCWDWHGSYDSEASDNPTGPEGGYRRVHRGGDWSTRAQTCRVSFRSYDTPGSRDDRIGFRLVSSLQFNE